MKTTLRESFGLNEHSNKYQSAINSSKNKPLIWTIGHSNHSLSVILEMLHSFDITLFADVRSYPGSNYVSHFNKENSKKSLTENDTEYMHIKKLCGRRKAVAVSRRVTIFLYFIFFTLNFHDLRLIHNHIFHATIQ